MTQEDSALATLLNNISKQIDNLASSQESFRQEIRTEISAMRSDFVPRSEHKLAIDNVGSSIDNVRAALVAHSVESKVALNEHAVDSRNTSSALAARVDALDKFRWILVGMILIGAGAGASIGSVLGH